MKVCGPVWVLAVALQIIGIGGGLYASNGVTYDVSLNPGPNLVSLPIDPTHSHLAAVLIDATGSHGFLGSTAYLHDPEREPSGWTAFGVGRRYFLNNMHRVHVGLHEGFWVHVPSAKTMTLEGTTAGEVIIPIRQGWTLIGYPSTTARSIATALAGVADAVVRVRSYDGSNVGSEWSEYDPADVPGSTLTTLEPGFGYWVESSRDDVWRFNGAGYGRELPDLRVLSVWHESASLDEGDDAIVCFKFGNVGAQAAQIVAIDVTYEFGDGSSSMQTLTFPAIEPGSPQTSTRSLYNLPAGLTTVTVEMDPSDTVAEADEANNTAVHLLDVHAPLDVTASAVPTGGEAPLKVALSAEAEGGRPGYQYLWFSGDTNSSTLDPETEKVGSDVSFIYSHTGTHAATVDVLDARDHRTTDSVNFGIQSNSNTLATDFGVSIDNVRITGNNTVAVDLIVQNSEPQGGGPQYAGPVRLTVRIIDASDDTLYEVAYDDLVQILGTSPQTGPR